MELIDRIINLLKEKGAEQKDLAEYLGVHPQLITEWKAGRTKSYKKYIDKIADFFNVSTDYLLGKDEIKKRPTPKDVELIEEARAMSPLFDEIAKLVLRLPPDKQKQAAEYVRFLLSQSGHADSNKED